MSDIAQRLSPDHIRMLRDESGISEDVILARGYRTVTKTVDLADMDFTPIQMQVPALLIPLHGVDGMNGRYMLRPDNARVIEHKDKGKLGDGTRPCSVIKYESQTGMPSIIDCPPVCLKDIGDPSIVLYITEGSKKADALASRGLCAVALQGVWNFKGRNSKDGKTLLPDFDRIAWNGRDVRIVFDSDVTVKPSVRGALDMLSAHAGKKGAKVARVVLPNVDGKDKTGIDDWFVSGGTVEQLNSLAQMAALQGEAHGKPPTALDADGTADDEGNAQFAAKRMGDKYVHCTQLGWMHFTGTHLNVEDGEKRVDRAVINALCARRADAVTSPTAYSADILKAARQNAKNVNNCKTLLASIITCNIGQLDNCPDVVNFRNGIVDLRTGALTPHHETQHRFTYCCPIDYDENIDMGHVYGFFASALRGGDRVAKFLFRMLGYGITGHTSLEKFLYIYGAPRSGKGTLVEMLLETFPTLCMTTTYATLAQQSRDVNDFRLAKLKPARIVIADEGERKVRLDAERIKLLTGGTPLDVAFKYGHPFTFKPMFMPMIISNNKLVLDADEDAVWTRPRIVEFPNSHAHDEDPAIKAGLKTPKALQQLAALLVLGARDFYATGMRTVETPPEVEDTTKSHRADADDVQQWLDERCDVSDKGAKSPRAQCHGAFVEWSKQMGNPNPIHGKRFYASLRKKGLVVPDDTERDESGNVTRLIHGLRFA